MDQNSLLHAEASAIALNEPVQFVELIPIIIEVIQLGLQLYQKCHPAQPAPGAEFLTGPDKEDAKSSIALAVRRKGRAHGHPYSRPESFRLAQNIIDHGAKSPNLEGVYKLCVS